MDDTRRGWQRRLALAALLGGLVAGCAGVSGSEAGPMTEPPGSDQPSADVGASWDVSDCTGEISQGIADYAEDAVGADTPEEAASEAVAERDMTVTPGGSESTWVLLDADGTPVGRLRLIETDGGWLVDTETLCHEDMPTP